MFLRPCIVAACTLLLCGKGLAQNPEAQAPAAASVVARYTKEPAFTEVLETVYRYRADGTGTKTDTTTVRVQTAAGVQALDVLRVPFLPGFERIDFTGVRVRKPTGQVIETPSTDAQEQLAPLTTALPDLSTVRYAVLGIRGLAPGDTLDIGIRTTFFQARIPGQFWGADGLGQGRVILKRIVELHVPGGENLLVASPQLQPELTSTPAEKIYRWTGAQLTPTVLQTPATRPGGEPAAPALAWSTFTSWAEVGAWYAALVNAAAIPTPDVKRQADQVVYGLHTPEARLQALYRYLATSIRAVNVPLQYKPFHPHTATEVLEAQLGDSLDRAVLFAALCRAEGLVASPALIAPGQTLLQAVPSPEQFGEVITEVQNGPASPVWLDTASETAPFTALSSGLRDRSALVLPAQGTSSLQRTPATLPYPQIDKFSSTGELSAEGTLTAHVDLTLRGDDELRLREAFHQTDESSWDRVTQLYLRSVNLQGTPSNTTPSTLADPGVPLQVSFDLSRPLYGDWAAHRIIPLEPGLNLPYTDHQRPEGPSLDLGAPGTASAQSRLTLPAGWNATPPPKLHVATPFAVLDKSCRIEKTSSQTNLLCDRVLQILQLRLPVERWPEYQAFLDQAAASEPWIQLTPPGTVASGSSSGQTPAANTMDAEGRLTQALGSSDPAAAEAALQHALSINPGSLPLKLALGTRLLQHGQAAQGAALLKDVAGASQNAAELNDAAFALGEAGLELRTAELASLHALRLLNSQPLPPLTDGSGQAALRQTLQLTACWDTLGWILFHEGSLSEAEIWLQAAWQDSFGAVAGQHLAQLLAKEGHRDEAARIAHLAAESEHLHLPTIQPPGQHTAQNTPPARSLLALLSIPVARAAHTPAGTARFEVERAETPESTTARWVSGDAALASMAEVLQHTDLHTIVPARTSVHIVRAGTLDCGPTGPCTFLLLPARAALAQ